MSFHCAMKRARESERRVVQQMGGGEMLECFPVSGVYGTKIDPTGDVFDHSPRKRNLIRTEVADHVGDHPVPWSGCSGDIHGDGIVEPPPPPQSLNDSDIRAPLGPQRGPAELRYRR